MNPAEYPQEAPAYLLKTKWHCIRSHRTKPLSFSCLAGTSLKNRPVLPSFQTIKHRPLLRFDLGQIFPLPFPSPLLTSKVALEHQERGSKGGHLLFSVSKLLLRLGAPSASSNAIEQLRRLLNVFLKCWILLRTQVRDIHTFILLAQSVAQIQTTGKVSQEWSGRQNSSRTSVSQYGHPWGRKDCAEESQTTPCSLGRHPFSSLSQT